MKLDLNLEILSTPQGEAALKKFCAAVFDAVIDGTGDNCHVGAPPSHGGWPRWRGDTRLINECCRVNLWQYYGHVQRAFGEVGTTSEQPGWMGDTCIPAYHPWEEIEEDTAPAAPPNLAMRRAIEQFTTADLTPVLYRLFSERGDHDLARAFAARLGVPEAAQTGTISDLQKRNAQLAESLEHERDNLTRANSDLIKNAKTIGILMRMVGINSLESITGKLITGKLADIALESARRGEKAHALAHNKDATP